MILNCKGVDLNLSNEILDKKPRGKGKSLEVYGEALFRQAGFYVEGLSDPFSFGGKVKRKPVLSDFFASKDTTTFFIEAKFRKGNLTKSSLSEREAQVLRIIQATLSNVPIYYLVCLGSGLDPMCTPRELLDKDIYLVPAPLILRIYLDPMCVGYGNLLNVYANVFNPLFLLQSWKGEMKKHGTAVRELQRQKPSATLSYKTTTWN